MQIKLRWLGNAGFEFHFGNTVLLVDPFLTRPRPSALYFGRTPSDLQAIAAHADKGDHILVTHSHFDHFMDVPSIAKRSGAVIHGSPNTCVIAGKLGIPENQLHLINAGDEFEIADICVKTIRAAHPFIPGYTNGRLRENLTEPLRLHDYRMDSCLSFLIKWQAARILVWSSTHINDAPPADVLICRSVSSQRWYDAIFKAVNPRWFIPAHWDDMFHPLCYPVRPFLTAPRLAFPPLQHISLERLAGRIEKANPESHFMAPERFQQEILYIP